MKIKNLLILCLMGLSCQQASAQFDNILNKLERTAKSSMTKATKNAGKSAIDAASKEAKKIQRSKAEVHTWTYGDHTYTMKGTLTADKYNKDAFGVVTFTNIPSDYTEFEALYNEFFGRTPYGTVAMMTMAMEMYARDRKMGRKCIELVNYKSNVSSVIRRLNDKFGAQPGDSYGQRYLPAAVLEGATPNNAYCPNRPYTINMEASVNKHQELQISGSGTVMYVYVIGGGWDSVKRSVELIRETDQEYYQIFNCPTLYISCKQIRGTWGGLE